jgi:hypothetical protein
MRCRKRVAGFRPNLVFAGDQFIITPAGRVEKPLALTPPGMKCEPSSPVIIGLPIGGATP